MIQTFHYKYLTRQALPSLSDLLSLLPEADIINVSQTETLGNDDYPVGYKKVTMVHKGHRYAITVRRKCPVLSRYVLEVSVSPHYHIHDGSLLSDFKQFVMALSE